MKNYDEIMNVLNNIAINQIEIKNYKRIKLRK